MSGLYFVCVLGLLLFLRIAPENTWELHVFLFSPRWMVGLPLLLLLPLAAVYRTWLLVPLLVAFVIVLFPISGFVVPWRLIWSRPATGVPLRILCCNTDGLRLDIMRLDGVIAEYQPELIILQEWAHRELPRVATEEGWTVLDQSGELFVASRHPIRQVRRFTRSRQNGARATEYELQLGELSAELINLHLQSPRAGLSGMLGSRHGYESLENGIVKIDNVLDVQIRGAREASEWIGEPSRSVIVAGDFNLMVESPIYRRNWSRFTDAFSAVGFGLGHTFIGAHHFSVRIDHVLTGPGWRPRRCLVGPDVGAEHRPLIVDLVWEGPVPAVQQAEATELSEEPPITSTVADITKSNPPKAPPSAPLGNPEKAPKEKPTASTPSDAPRPVEPPGPSLPTLPGPAPRPEPDAAPIEPGPSLPRRNFHDELGKALAMRGKRSVEAIRELCARAERAGLNTAPDSPLSGSSSRNYRAIVRTLRSRGVSEAAILRALAALEVRNIGRRNGPTSRDDALVRAARTLLDVPLD